MQIGKRLKEAAQSLWRELAVYQSARCDPAPPPFL